MKAKIIIGYVKDEKEGKNSRMSLPAERRR
jgi:hypothetical protein